MWLVPQGNRAVMGQRRRLVDFSSTKHQLDGQVPDV